MRPVHIILALVSVLGLSCKDDPGTSGPGAPAYAEPTKPVVQSNVTVMKPPVAYGRKIPCANLIDITKMGAALGKEVVLNDKSQVDAEAAAVCQIKLGGTPPSEKEQKRMFEKNNRVMGTLPGDEICQVTAYCSFIFDKDEQKKKCEADGQTVNQEIGDLTCVKTYEAAAEYKYVYTVLDADTKCKLVINPGPSVTDDATVKTCTKTASELITLDTLK